MFCTEVLLCHTIINNMVLFCFQSVYGNISRVLEVADKLSEAVHYESDRIEALAQAVSREWKSFDMNINQRSCLLARSVAYHKHSEEVRHRCQPVKIQFWKYL